MRVKGDILDVQSNLDFYLKIVSTGNIKSVEGLRNHFFNIFLKEEKEQNSTLLKEKNSLEIRKKEELQENSILDEGKENLEEENKDEILQDNFKSNSISFLNAVSNIKCEEYTEHGIYLDDLWEEDAKEEVKDGLVIEEEYVSHGIYLEDLPDEPEGETVENEDYYNDWKSDEEEYNEDWDDYNNELFEGEEEEYEVEREEYEGTEEESLVEEEYEVEREEYKDTGEEGLVEEEFLEESVDGIIEEVPEEGIVVSKESDLDLEVSKEEDPINVPNDLREFLRQHPNSELSYVTQFYTKKEIEKQIKLGRVYKKRGKLFI